MSKFKLEIVTPEKKFYDDEAENVIITTPTGEMGILAGHEPSLVAVQSGVIKILSDGKWKEAAISEGFMEVTHERTIAMVDTAEWPEEIDINRANEAKTRAMERLTQKMSRAEYLRSQAALARALARLKVTRMK